MLELLPTAKFECDIIACTSSVIAKPIPKTIDFTSGLYFLPVGWQAYNKYNAKGELVPYHICPKHEIFKRR